MIIFRISGNSPVEMNMAAKLLLEHPLLEVDRDSGNKNGRKVDLIYLRYIHAKVLRNKPDTNKRPARLDGAAKMSLATQCWQHIVHKTDADDEAIEAIVKLIEYVEKVKG